MATWAELLAAVEGNRSAWFRGQRRPWPVRSKLHRLVQARLGNPPIEELPPLADYRRLVKQVELNMYNTFRTLAWPLLDDRSRTRWEVLFAMQHHKVPTRLIDFTRSLPVALYFALQVKEGDDRPTVILVKPGVLNYGEGLYTLDDHEAEGVGAGRHPLDPLPEDDHAKVTIAVVPNQSHARMVAQQSTFLATGDFPAALNQENPDAVITLPLDAAACREATRFLRLSGIGESALFPDLESIGRDVMRGHGLGEFIDNC